MKEQYLRLAEVYDALAECYWVTSEVLPAIRKTGHYSLSGYNSRVTGVGEIVNLLKLSKDMMQAQGCNSVDIALMMKAVC